ncbi:hypothetical protein PPROV_000874100 [Pycnococcus provasolii]|uniref:histidine kinase n=1 Tax=Pycnococcus provasolii TaxID=41880 RepID=A0A830HSQ2_9CHLO|nr:hypothetical protein PPROV_000874100 [Pycnococcus provasolii]
MTEKKIIKEEKQQREVVGGGGGGTGGGGGGSANDDGGGGGGDDRRVRRRGEKLCHDDEEENAEEKQQQQQQDNGDDDDDDDDAEEGRAAKTPRRRSAEFKRKNLEMKENWMQFFLDSSNDVFVVYGLDEGSDTPHYMYANSMGLSLLGFGGFDDPYAVVGLTNEQIMGKDQAAVCDAAVLECFRTRERVDIVHPVDIPGLPVLTYESVYNFVDDVNGDTGTKFVLGVCRDITKRVESERKVRLAQAQAEEATRSKSLMIARVSHDLRTPLVGVMNATELLLQSVLTPDQRQLMSLVGTSSRLLLALANDITDLSSIEQGRISLELFTFDLRMCLRECVELVRMRAEEGGVRLVLDDDDDDALPQQVIQDGIRFRQVLYNLLYNAIKFTPKDGRVTLRARRMSEQQQREQVTYKKEKADDSSIKKSWVVFWVEDTGVGISADVAPKLFQPFSQGERHHNETISAVNAGHERGTGLGLVISKSLAELMGGSLELVRSTLGEGSLFKVVLPFATPSPSSVDDEDTARANDHHAQMPVEDMDDECDHLRSSLRVMIADDNPVNRIVLQKLMQSYTNQKPITVSDGVEAVEMATGEQRPFDLILMDQHMPRLDGSEAVQQIRSILSSRGEEAPMIAIVTASAMSGDRQACLETCKTDDYLTKPVIKHELERVLRSACTMKMCKNNITR